MGAALGMVAVPMFGPERKDGPGDEHSILLDGPMASLAFTVGDADNLLALPDPLDWAWSTNLTFSVILDRNGKKIFTRRWDKPDENKKWSMPAAAEVEDFFAEVTRDAKPTATTVVEKLLEVFWILRTNIEQRNGINTDLVRSFNALLVWADTKRRKLIDPQLLTGLTTLESILPVLKRHRLINFGPDQLSNDHVRSFAIGSMLDEMLERDHAKKVVLDPDLFIRHAAGVLYEAAHIELNSRPLTQRVERQRQLFGDEYSLDATPPQGQPSRDIHFTPTSLARALVEEARRAILSLRQLPDPLKILDPASGSGVFLVEAARELLSEAETSLILHGIDRSPVACIMTEFCLSRTDSVPGRPKPQVEVTECDSLKMTAWDSYDLILTNPRFIAWEDLSDADREEVNLASATETQGFLITLTPSSRKRSTL